MKCPRQAAMPAFFFFNCPKIFGSINKSLIFGLSLKPIKQTVMHSLPVKSQKKFEAAVEALAPFAGSIDPYVKKYHTYYSGWCKSLAAGRFKTKFSATLHAQNDPKEIVETVCRLAFFNSIQNNWMAPYLTTGLYSIDLQNMLLTLVKVIDPAKQYIIKTIPSSWERVDAKHNILKVILNQEDYYSKFI